MGAYSPEAYQGLRSLRHVRSAFADTRKLAQRKHTRERDDVQAYYEAALALDPKDVLGFIKLTEAFTGLIVGDLPENARKAVTGKAKARWDDVSPEERTKQSNKNWETRRLRYGPTGQRKEVFDWLP